MTRTEVISFLRSQNHGAVSTVNERGQPQSAVVGYAVSDALELVFDTLGDTRKAMNLRRDAKVSFVMWDEAQKQTVQLEGVADEPQGAELQRLKALYFSVFPDGREREKWPGITWVRIKPHWVRHSDFRGEAPKLTVL